MWRWALPSASPPSSGASLTVGVAAVEGRVAGARTFVARGAAVSAAAVGVAFVGIIAIVRRAAGVPAVVALCAAVGAACVTGRSAGVPVVVAMGASVGAEANVVRVAGVAAEALGTAVGAAVVGGGGSARCHGRGGCRGGAATMRDRLGHAAAVRDRG